MKKIVVLCVAAVAFASCGGNAEGVTIDEQNAMNAAYDLSLELATAVVEAESYEAFKSAREALVHHRRHHHIRPQHVKKTRHSGAASFYERKC